MIHDKACKNAHAALVGAKRDMLNGCGSVEAGYAAAEEYRDALKDWKQRKGHRKFRVPSAAQLIRQVT
ncbi:hypothetical protein HC928_01400 [bacterium]|nr:hypothetical protein [bacterium]